MLHCSATCRRASTADRATSRRSSSRRDLARARRAGRLLDEPAAAAHRRARGRIEGAARQAGNRAKTPLEQLDHRSAKRRDTARNLRIEDPAESTPEAEATSFAAELVKALEAEADQPGPDDAAIKRVAWCARQALRNSNKRARR